MAAMSVTGGSSYAGSVVSSRSSASLRARAEKEHQEGQSEDLLDRRSPLENGIFGVLFTLSKENSETRIRIRWVLLKILLDGWQLFTTVINPEKQGWAINANGTAWLVVSVLNFQWLESLGYGAYLAVLYSMVALLAFNVGLCVWVAWCFKEHKFPVVWPIKVLRVFSSVFFQAFDVASLNLLQLGISCNYTGPDKPRLHFTLMPSYSCTTTPHIMHAVVSALSLVLFVTIALLLNMAEVEVNPLSRRPLALGHSGAEVMAFAIKVLMTMVDVFLGWKTVSACVYMGLALALAYQTLRWSPHLVAWMNYLKSGISVSICWCCIALMLLVFKPGIKKAQEDTFANAMTIAMLAGLAPAFATGAFLSWSGIRRMTKTALTSLANAKPEIKLEDICDNLDDPRDVEIVGRCCRVWKDRYTLDPDAITKAHHVIKAGLAMFPNSAYMVLLHGNFMIDVLGVSQSGSSRIEDARKLSPSLMCRFIMFVRQQQATQKAAGSHANDGASMDLLGYVEYQRKQRMVVRLHREALQAMCNFWKALDASKVSFMHLSKALGKIESSVSQAQTAYRVVLESYGNNPKLVRLYGKFLQTIKNDPWRASEYFAEADRLEELKNGDARGPLLPDGTPLGRMDEMSTAVMVINSTGEIQMANRHTHLLFGYKRGTLEAKPMATLLAPHLVRRVAERLTRLVSTNGIGASAAAAAEEAASYEDELVVGMHYERLAFPVKLSLRKVSGVGEDSTFIAMLEPVPPISGVASLWVAPNGTVAACDPQFVANFGWRAAEVNGSNIVSFITVNPQGLEAGSDPELGSQALAAYGESTTDSVNRLLTQAKLAAADGRPEGGLRCLVAHKYDMAPVSCLLTVLESGGGEMPVLEIRIKREDDPSQLMVVNRKGSVMHVSSELVPLLKDVARSGPSGPKFNTAANAGVGGVGQAAGPRFAAGAAVGVGPSGTGLGLLAPGAEELAGFTLSDFLPPPWKDMHVKFLKDTSPLVPPARGLLACRKGSPPGPTLELRSASGKPLFMQVSVTSMDVSGEVNHVVRMTRSSLESALDERRLRLTVAADGLITGMSDGAPRQMFRLDPSQVIGRGLWEIVNESGQVGEGGRLTTPGPRVVSSFVNRAMMQPGSSWRVNVAPPQKPARASGAVAAGVLDLSSAARAAQVHQAVMQVSVDLTQDSSGRGNGTDRAAQVFVDLWPLSCVTGVLEIDPMGCVRAVLEERLRPAGLLFGLPNQAVVGSLFTGLITMPHGRTRHTDLLSLSALKKSSLKSSKKETSVKVGPVHVLQAVNSDGDPVQLDVQLVGKPGIGQACHAILRFHVGPMMPNGATLPAGVGASASPMVTSARSATLLATPSFSTRFGGQTQEASPFSVTKDYAASAAVNAATPQLLTRSATAADANRLVTPPPVGAPERLKISILDSAPAATGGAAAPVSAVATILCPSKSTPENLLAVRRSLTHDTHDTAGSGVRAGGSPRPTGYSNALDDDALAAGLTSPSLDILASVGESLPIPGVTTGKGGGVAAGRSKLADLVRAVGAERPDGISGSGGLDGKSGARLAAAASGRPIAKRDTRAGALERRGSGPQQDFDPLISAEALAIPGLTSDVDVLIRAGSKPPPIDVESVAESDNNQSDKEARKPFGGNERISTWVASKGAFYQNSVATGKESDDDRSRRSGDFSDGQGGPDMVAVVRAEPFSPAKSGDSERKSGPPLPTAPRADYSGGYPDDDAASEGGQSAMSAQSAGGGAEYKRGKRFRKLIKLMDSSQAQQVQERFRTHALGTVAILAIVHVVCFALIIVAIESQRHSMLTLGHNGETQRFMNQIMIDVRSLDVISRNMTQPNLYTAADAPFFIRRISRNADIVKDRLNEMLAKQHDPQSPVMKLFFYHPVKVWNGIDIDGTDLYTNLTIWDFGTRFYAMARNIVQHYDDWMDQGLYVANTDAGNLILKSGPDLFIYSRKILDALLYEAAANVHWVDTLQLVFLAVEGTVISSMAAFYLAYLLRAVAAQRHKLYATFLVIPLGLTRALASQNTALLVDEDEDEDDDDDDERPAPTVEEGAEGEGESKVKRRATLNIAAEVSSPPSPVTPTGGPGDGRAPGRKGPSGLQRSLSAAQGKGMGMADLVPTGDKSELDRQRSGMSAMSDGCEQPGRSERRGFRPFSRMVGWLHRRVKPLPAANGGQPGAPPSKRKLKDDSHETVIMMVPFVFWSAVVIAIYSIAVVHMQGVVDVVAIHSVSNFMAARTYRTIFYCQELAAANKTELQYRRENVNKAIKLVRDAWYTLQLGENAYLAAGPNTERFPLVKDGLSHASTSLATMFYGTNICHRSQENLPCVGPDSRFYEVTHTGLDSMMQQFMMSLAAMANSRVTDPAGLADEHFDYVYNVGGKDLADGTITVEMAHYDTIVLLFHNILILHVILFLVLWVVFAGFLILLLNPLLKRISKERRRIAELMSQLPLELDVEKLVAKALGAMPNPSAPGAPTPTALTGPPASTQSPSRKLTDDGAEAGGDDKGQDATHKWKAIIRSASANLNTATKAQRSSGASFKK